QGGVRRELRPAARVPEAAVDAVLLRQQGLHGLRRGLLDRLARAVPTDGRETQLVGGGDASAQARDLRGQRRGRLLYRLATLAPSVQDGPQQAREARHPEPA